MANQRRPSRSWKMDQTVIVPQTISRSKRSKGMAIISHHSAVLEAKLEISVSIHQATEDTVSWQSIGYTPVFPVPRPTAGRDNLTWSCRYKIEPEIPLHSTVRSRCLEGTTEISQHFLPSRILYMSARHLSGISEGVFISNNRLKMPSTFVRSSRSEDSTKPCTFRMGTTFSW